MDYQKTAETILKSVGGKENVEMLTHCATRLRFTLIDESKLDLSQAKKIDGVIDAVKSSGQYQFIIGTDVVSAYNELQKVGLGEQTGEVKQQGSKKILDRLFDAISGIFTPLIPALTAAGMLKALLVILSVTNVISVESQTYQILNFVADTAFYFLPVFAAISTAYKFRCNLYIAGIIGAMLIHPTFIEMVQTGEPIRLLGISVPLVSYSSSVIPSILAVWFMSYVEKFADRVSPKAVKFLLKPLLTLLIVFPVTFLLFGPLGSFVGNLLSNTTESINQVAPWLVSALMGALFPLLVLTGMHWSFVPVIVQSYASFGYEGVMGPGSFVSNICQGAAALAVAFKTKDSKLKQVASSAGITALLGVTEPALFGVTLRMKKALYAVMIGGGIGGLYAGLNGVVRYTSGTPGLASFAIFIGENPMNVVHALISVLIGFIATFVITWMIVDPDKALDYSPEETQTKTERPVIMNTQQQTIKSPIKGEIIPLSKVNDAAFANEILGKGIAVYPEEGLVYAPFDGKVMMTFKTGHAIGLVNEQGVELLIHVGLDTVKMEGNGFKLLVKEGQTVHSGDPILEFDPALIKEAGFDMITPIIITNALDDMEIVVTDQAFVNQNETLMVVL